MVLRCSGFCEFYISHGKLNYDAMNLIHIFSGMMSVRQMSLISLPSRIMTIIHQKRVMESMAHGRGGMSLVTNKGHSIHNSKITAIKTDGIELMKISLIDHLRFGYV